MLVWQIHSAKGNSWLTLSLVRLSLALRANVRSKSMLEDLWGTLGLARGIWRKISDSSDLAVWTISYRD